MFKKFRLPVIVAVALYSPLAGAADIPVADTQALLDAIAAAKAGDTIILAPGTYEVHQSKIACEAAGTADQRIVVRASEPGTAVIKFDAVEGFHVRGPFWEFDGLDIEGICADDNDCEHAFHVTGNAESTWIHHTRMHGFNAMIKGNGEPIGPNNSYVWPDDVVIEYNELFNPAPRNTGNPVTPIDVVGGQRWILRGNFIHDHAKGGGDNISYAAFLKGHSKDGIIERNLVACELLHTGQIRLGLSLGGGGTGPDSICEDGACKPEHERGIVRNNIIVNCPADVGMYINAGADSKILNNTLFNTGGIDMRFAQTTGLVQNNLLMGKIRDRDGAITTKMNNVVEATLDDFMSWFVAPGLFDFTPLDSSAFLDLGLAAPEVTDDYCTNDRDDGKPDIGALEYDDDYYNGGACGGFPFDPGDPGDTTGTSGDTSTTDATTDDPGTSDPSAGTDPTSTTNGTNSTDPGTTGDDPTGGSDATTNDPGTTGGTATSGDTAASASGTDSSTPADDDSGCSCRSDPTPASTGLLALALLALRRRRST
jgi:MYXO-CTERM domain-containing protein